MKETLFFSKLSCNVLKTIARIEIAKRWASNVAEDAICRNRSRPNKEIKKENPQLTNTMAAMLAAINLSDEYIKLVDSMDNLRKQVAEYAKNESKLSAALDDRTARVKALEETVQELRLEVARLGGNASVRKKF